MSQFPQHRASSPWQARENTTDVAVFNFFNTVYAWMAVGLGVTAVVGYGVASTPALAALFFGSLAVPIVVALAAFALSMYVQANIGRISAGTATVLFLVYAALMGALTSYIYRIYPVATLGTAFLLTAGTFGGMSVYGFVTKRDLSRIGSIAVMAVWGFILASLVNIFLQNNFISWLITYGVLALFIVITAYETQMLKAMAQQFRGNPQMAQRVAIVGSLVLYISFLNMFLSILRILGDRR